MYRMTLGLLLLIPVPASAFKPAPPERHDVFSPNRQFVLDVDPKTKTNTVYLVNDRKNPLWSFEGVIWLGPAFLADDGNSVAVISWEHVQVEGLREETCIRFRNKGGLLKSYTFGEICPNPRRQGWFERGPVGSFWRVWYSNAEQKGNLLRVATTDLYEYTFSLENGSIVATRFQVGSFLRKYWTWIAGLIVGGLVLYVFFKWRFNKRYGN